MKEIELAAEDVVTQLVKSTQRKKSRHQVVELAGAELVNQLIQSGTHQRKTYQRIHQAQNKPAVQDRWIEDSITHRTLAVKDPTPPGPSYPDKQLISTGLAVVQSRKSGPPKKWRKEKL